MFGIVHQVGWSAFMADWILLPLRSIEASPWCWLPSGEPGWSIDGSKHYFVFCMWISMCVLVTTHGYQQSMMIDDDDMC